MTSHIRISDVTPLVQAVAEDLEVWTDAAVVSSGYTVLGEGSSTGGAVIFAVAPASGVRITLRRRQTYARTGDFLDDRAPTPHELNDAVDRNVAAIQELAEEVSRAVHRAPSADLSRPVDLTLPQPEAGKVIGWNGSADALVNLTQVDASDMLRKSQNLADLSDKAQARINLGLGSAASHDVTEFATAAQGVKADTAVQPSALGSAASHAASDFATAAQGAKADTAVQPSVIDTSTALAANSDNLIPSQKAVKAYVDGKLSSGGNLRMQVFTTSGTFVTPAGTSASTTYEFTLTGGGGGSGGMEHISEGATGGGGGGATAIWHVSGLTAGSSCPVVVGTAGAAGPQNGAGGNGGASSVTAGGVTVTAGGGSGSAGLGTALRGFTFGGAGGIATGGTLNLPGGEGQIACIVEGLVGGQGGDSFWGNGGRSDPVSGGSSAAAAYGSGAGGQVNNYQGHSGAPGIVVVRWIG